MATLDLLHHAGGSAANFLDTAQIDDEGIIAAFDLLARAGGHRALLVNMFAGLNRCDALAEGVRRYLAEHPSRVPVVVRMVGKQDRPYARPKRRAHQEVAPNAPRRLLEGLAAPAGGGHVNAGRLDGQPTLGGEVPAERLVPVRPAAAQAVVEVGQAHLERP